MTNEFSETAGQSPATVTPPNAADGREALAQRMDRIESQLERLSLALETSTAQRADAQAAAGRTAEPVDGVELGGRAKAETLHRESTAKRVTDGVSGSMAGADATVRDWFDRRPFLFMTGLFIAALVVFQIID
ncbi:hypothetical protein [Rhizobium sp. EC-SD404]|uniref:hypothetical protein n=1 Tax=Rhizobium sp. EC-SD404 TaxID=2038389 RepID=UPI0012581E99|nr:hypothetical protein [Rhizobium sp. EC-SD404]VVT22550.1 hypothetical protein RHIZ404_220105 [Rhizobium sp. EC-SD404]